MFNFSSLADKTNQRYNSTLTAKIGQLRFEAPYLLFKLRLRADLVSKYDSLISPSIIAGGR